MIGLCLAFEQENNYGTQLQAFATVEAVKELGFDFEIIIYHKNYSLFQKMKQINRLFHDGMFCNMLHGIKRSKLVNQDTPFGRGYRERCVYVKRFKDKYLLPYSTVYNGYEELVDGVRKYTTVLVGSDQVWLPAGYASQFYNLMFVPDDISKVSYASSFGVSSIPVYHLKEAKEFLDRMDYISVRELKGKEIVESVSDNKATVVVDPTMLIDRTIWEKMCVPIDGNRDYIFCYFLGIRREGREQAIDLQKKTGLKIVVLKHLDGYIAEDDDFGDECPYNVGPEKFISFIKNAAFVLTDSFHGTVFSILFQKRFITFYRNNQSDSLSKNSRIDSLLGQLGIKDRLYSGEEIYKKINEEIDYTAVQEKLELLRNESKEFLRFALFACENNDLEV